MKKLNEIERIPTPQLILWRVIRVLTLIYGIYGLFTNSVTMLLMSIFTIAFTHLWDFFQLFGGKSFITRVPYSSQTAFNIFIFYGCVIGYTLNSKTNFPYSDIITHTLSGVIATWFAYDLAVAIQGKKRHLSPALASLFSFTFSMFLAVAWELYEFTMDRVYGYMLQTSDIISEVGIVDTMEDFICCAIGSVLGMFFIAFYRNGIIGPNRKERRAKVKAQSKLDRKEELEYLGIAKESRIP